MWGSGFWGLFWGDGYWPSGALVAGGGGDEGDGVGGDFQVFSFPQLIMLLGVDPAGRPRIVALEADGALAAASSVDYVTVDGSLGYGLTSDGVPKAIAVSATGVLAVV